MIQEQNTDRVRRLAQELGIDYLTQDKLMLTFARNSQTVVCRLARQRPDGRYQTMEISADLLTGDRQLEQITSDRAASEMSRAITTVIDQAYGLPPQPSSRKGVFLLPKEGPSTILRYHWDDTKSQYKLVDTEQLDTGAVILFSGIADKMISVTNSFEA